MWKLGKKKKVGCSLRLTEGDEVRCNLRRMECNEQHFAALFIKLVALGL